MFGKRRRFSVLALGLLICAANQALAFDSIKEVFASIESSDLHLQEANHAPATSRWFSPLRFDFLKWTPSGEKSAAPLTCHFAERDPRQPRNFQQFRAKLERYLAECEKEFQDGPTDGLRSFYSSFMSRLNVREHPYARHVIFDLPGSVKLKGLLALHDDQPRPLLIFRLGIFSNTEEFYPERFVFTDLFEQGPFNVLLLESMSGTEFVERNGVRAFGGLDEGVQTLQILRRLKDPAEPLGRLVSSVHLGGVSMGGQGQLLAHLLQSKQVAAPWVNSTLLFCPLLNLRETFEGHLASSRFSWALNGWAKLKFPFLLEQNPALDNDHFLQDLLRGMARNYTGPLSDEDWIRWPSELKKNRGDFWKGNDFLGEVQNVQTPLLIFATKQDPIVPYALNSGRIEKGELSFGSTPWMLATLKEGTHCSLPGPYDGAELNAIMQGYLLTFSPELHSVYESSTFELQAEVAAHLQQVGWHPRWRVELRPGESLAHIAVEFLPDEDANFWERWRSPRSDFSLTLNRFDFLQAGNVESRSEIDLFRRWITQNVQVEWVPPKKIRFVWRRVVAPADL